MSRVHAPARRLLFALLVIVVTLVLGGSTARAATDIGSSTSDGSWFTINGNVTIGDNDVIDGSAVLVNGNLDVSGVVRSNVFVVNGNVRVTGRVGGDVVLLNGTATVNGEVGGSVTVVNGTAVVGGQAVVGGDVQSSSQPAITPGAKVSGSVGRTDWAAWATFGGLGLMFGWWLVVTISTLLLGLAFVGLFTRAATAARTASVRYAGASVATAAVLALALPAAAFVGVASVVALPLGVALLASLLLVYPLGYVVAASALGGIMVKGRPLGAFFAGWGILRAIALVPGLGIVVWILASAFGVGALAVAAWRARSTTRGEGLTGELPPAPQAPAQPLPPPLVGANRG